MYRIAIVDDEPGIRESLRDGTQAAARDAGYAAEITLFPSAESLIRNYTSFDLVLLDIQLKGMNGMQCAEWIRQRDPNVQLIFITSMVQYAVQGYKVNALDYIVKPVGAAQLKMSLQRAFKRMESLRPQVIIFRASGGMTTVSVSDILFVEAVNHSASARTKDKPVHFWAFFNQPLDILIVREFRDQYVYEMMRLNREATPFETLGHIAGVHHVAMTVSRGGN